MSTGSLSFRRFFKFPPRLQHAANDPASQDSGLLDGLKVQARVIHALILRDTLTTHGRSDIGYLWALVEPLILLGMFLLIFTYRKTGDHGGMNLVTFLMTGIITYTALRGMAKSISKAIDSNRGLMLYPQVTPIDTMVARGILQAATMLMVFLIIIFGCWMLGYGVLPHDWLGVLEALGAIAMLGFGLGLLQNALLRTLPAMKHVLSPLWRLLLFTSCVFYNMKDLPMSLQNMIYYNPVAHGIELLRKSFFAGFQTPITGYSYIATWVIVALFIGLTAERAYRFKSKRS